MISINDHTTVRCIDPWGYMEPKRRQLLEKSWAGLFRRHLFEKTPVQEIAKHFNVRNGRPTKEFYTVIGTVVLQQMHDLTDGQTIEALAFNEQWHYALDITSESDAAKYLCEKTLRTYRTILIEEKVDTLLFKAMTDALLEHFDVDTSKQRIDSTHICSNMRTLRRIEIFAKTITGFLKKLEHSYRDLFEASIGPELSDRYFRQGSDGCFSRVKPSEAAPTIQKIAEDLFFLVEYFKSNKKVKKLRAYKLLTRVLSEQCRVTESGGTPKVEIKAPKEIPADSLQNPSDADATYDGHKGQGYQVQIMETYQPVNDPGKRDKSTPNLITYVAVEPAHKNDEDALQPALDNTKARGCSPAEVQADAAYGSDKNVQEAASKGVTVVAPTKGVSGELKDFTFAKVTHEVVFCPEGHSPEKVKQTGSGRFTARFSKAVCSACPRCGRCPVLIGTKGAYVRYDEKQYRLAQRRAFEQTPEFLDTYRWRAGAEGTMSHYKKDFGAGRLRVRGMASVRFAATLKALGLNIVRAAKALVLSFFPSFSLILSHKTCEVIHKLISTASSLHTCPFLQYKLSKNANYSIVI